MRIIKPPRKGKNSTRSAVSDENSGGLEIIDSRELSLDGAQVGRKPKNKRKARTRTAIEGQNCDFANSSQRRINTCITEADEGDLSSPLQDHKKEYSRLLNSGVRLLAMREHSVKEIHDKLSRRSEMPDIVNAVLDELLANKYVSDERFTESYIRARSNKGFGPIKIGAELKSKGVSNSLIVEYLDMGSPIWIDHASTQYQKKYGAEGVSDYNTWTKRARFMQSRGFTMEHIQVALPEIEFD